VRRLEVPVLIVGAGPVGLAGALLCDRLGLAHRVVDRRPGPHRAPQAHVVNPRTLEILRQLGLDTVALRRLATPREDGGWVAWRTTLAGDELGRLPYERQGDDALAFTPEPLVNLPQHVLEPVLLESVAPETVHWRHEWRSLAEDAGGVTCRVRDLARGEDYEVRSRWVLAADGAGSPVRKALGVPMIGPDRLQSFLMVHFEANLRALVRDPAILYWIVDPAWMGSFIAHDVERTWVFMHPIEADGEAYDAARCAALVRQAIGRADVDLAVRDVGVWHMTAQVAASYRAGRLFLAGDSAHRFPPAGGMGMNTGIQDVHNLAWKLALVERGAATPALLDTYESERRPVAERNAAQSFVNAMRMLEAVGELGLDPGEVAASRARLAALAASAEGRATIARIIDAQREHFDMLGLQLGFAYEAGAVVPDGTAPPAVADPVRTLVQTARPGHRLPHVWVAQGGVRRSSLDLVAADAFTLLVGPDGAAVTEPGLRVLVAGGDFEDPSGAWLEACGIERDGALLVRPDQHVAWRAASGASGDGDGTWRTVLRGRASQRD
jgi:2,4-dichlorophenol 6-monooxygenase